MASVVAAAPAAPATRESAAVTTADPTEAITAMRQELIDSFNKGDMPRLLSQLDPDVVVTWQDGEVCRGPDAVKAYCDKKMTGPDRVVASVSADPKVTDRHVYGEPPAWAVSWGEMNDHFSLTDGRKLPLNSKFTATIARRGDVWKLTSFHLSVNAFDNPILKYAVGKAVLWAAVVTGLLALAAGLILGRVWGRRRKGTAAP